MSSLYQRDAAFGPTRVGTLMRAPKTAELIADHLRRSIVRGDLKPGQTLPPEMQLMEQFGVSRPTLREAFRVLEVESLIGVRRGSRGGAQVLEPDPMVAARHVGLLLQIQGTTVQDVYEARMITEPVCARLLAERRTEDDLADLQGAVDDLAAAVAVDAGDTPDVSLWSRATYRFHELVIQRCGNQTLAVQGAVLADIVDAHLRQSIDHGLHTTDHGDPSTGFQRTMRSYHKLIELVETKDSDAAEKHWRTHMEYASQFLFDGTIRLVDLFG